MASMIAPLSERYVVAVPPPPAGPVAEEPERERRDFGSIPDAELAEDVFVFPATAAQRRFWLLDQLVPGGNSALNMPIALRLSGRLDREALTRSLNEVVRRHEVLRTTFHCERGQLRQLIAPSQVVSLPLVDIRDFPAQEQAGLPEHLVEEEAQRPFDLRRGPVIRGRLVRVANEEHLLAITLHHIVSDGWSNGVLLRELGELYAAYVRGQPSPLPELPIQFADYCQWQQEHGASDPELANQMPYWREMLAGELPVLDLPTDRPRRAARGHASVGGWREETLPAPLVRSLKTLAIRAGVSPYMLHLAAFTILLSRYSGGQEDVLLNTPAANRDRSEVEPLIGPFVNPLLLRLDLSGDPSFGEFLKRVRRVVLGAFEHAAVSFEKLLEEIPPRRLQANFLYQSHFLRPARLPDLDLVPLNITNGATLAEWSGAVVEDDAGTHFSLAYNADLFDGATIDRALASYVRLLGAVAAVDGVEAAISQLPLELPPKAGKASALLAHRWRLPAATVRWLEGCLEAKAGSDSADFGLPRPGIEFLVLDRHRQTPPIGVVGEIYVRGLDNAAAGAGLPVLTWMERSPEGRLLKTGDLGRRLADDRIEWVGRADQEISVHGLRVNIAAIEAALRAHPHVREAVVIGRERSGDRQLTAFVESDSALAGGLSRGKLRDFLRATLPEEFIPTAFVPVESFPSTPDGRLDPEALSDLAYRVPVGAEETGDTPYLTIHHQLIDLWQELLGAPGVGIRDDFFALGGNSLLAMRMLYRIEQIFGKALLPVTLFKQPTIEHLAEEILKNDEGQTTAALVKINDQGSKTPIFFLHGDFHGGGFYAMKLSRHLGGEQPFYALPPAELTDPSTPPTIAQMAAQQIDRIREVRPHGPYVIGGFCLGGLIAFEVAQQLAAAGETVERLLIIEATLENRRLGALRQAAELCGRWRGLSADRQLYLFCRWHFLLARLERWGRMPLSEQVEVFGRRWRSGCRRVVRRVQAMGQVPAPNGFPVGVATTAGEADWFDPRWDVPLVYLWSAGAYTPQPYAGATTLLLSHDLFRGRQRGGRRTWKKYLRAMDERELPGSHLACITEHVDTLAETIARCLDPAPAAASEAVLASAA